MKKSRVWQRINKKARPRISDRIIGKGQESQRNRKTRIINNK